jgi:hypothetical protein
METVGGKKDATSSFSTRAAHCISLNFTHNTPRADGVPFNISIAGGPRGDALPTDASAAEDKLHTGLEISGM